MNMAAPSSSSPAANPSPELEARRLKSLAEEKLLASSLKPALKYARRARALFPSLDGLDLMFTVLKILRASPSDHYKILRLDPFSPMAAIKKQYKALALALHPDKAPSPLPGAEEAFKRVADSFRFLSDRTLKKDFDLSLRLDLASISSSGIENRNNNNDNNSTFWTACTTCRLLHEFDCRYIGHRLICPVCHKSFLAAEHNNSNNASERGVRVTAARSRSNTRPRIPMEWRKSVGASPNAKRPRQVKEKTLAEVQIELARAKKKRKGKEKSIVTVEEKGGAGLSLMEVEDSDFYDFDKDRTERCFAMGQVWAIYDDDDGMPRHYGLIDEVISVKPFRVKMRWLDVQSNGDEALLLRTEYHASCGRFKVGAMVDIHSVNLFSNLVECERAAKEVYRIYPRKGSVWALKRERNSGGEEGRSYDIVVLLTSYNEVYGLSMAYLEKVEGFKTIFKRHEVGCHAVRWFEKDDVGLFSHRIPARKVSDLEGVNLPKDCWELDPASLPPELLRISWERE